MGLALKTICESTSKPNTGRRDRQAVREGQSGQTIGVPIGPDTSFIIAEIVLTAVDHLLREKVPSLRGFRYLDDYEAAFPSQAEAEEGHVQLEGALGDFELVVNPYKTRIVELPQPFRETWPQELAMLPIRTGSARETLNDVIGLFSRAAEIARHHAGALKYALRRSMDAPVDSTVWSTLQALSWSAVSAEPTTLPTALDLLREKSSQADQPIDKAGAAEALEALILRHAPVRNASEVAWGLWAAILLEVDLSAKSADVISTMEDDFVALLALDADGRGRFPVGALDKSVWESLIDYDEVLHGPNWLMAYEGTLQGWLSSAVQRVAADRFFSVLQARDIHFYDKQPVRPPFTGPAGPLPGAPLPDSYL